MKKSIITCFLSSMMLIFIVLTAYPEKNDNLVFMTEDYPPANFLDHGVLKGYSVEILKLIWRQLGEKEQVINVYPWARGYYMIQNNSNHMLFTMGRTPDREKLFKWVGPISKSRYVLVGLKKKSFPLKKLGDAKKYKIGVLRDDVGESELLKSGFDKNSLELVNNLDQSIKMLNDGRVDLICINDRSFFIIAEELKLNSALFTIYLTVFNSRHYYAFNKNTSDKIIRKYQIALDSLNQERLEILKKYGFQGD